MDDDRRLIESLLAELHYVHTTGDVQDSIKNAREILNSAAVRCGYESYRHYAEVSDAN